MSALKQYIDLAASHMATLSKGCPDPINDLRQKAFVELEKQELDSHSTLHSPLSSLDTYAPDYGINIERHPLPVDITASFRCGAGQITPLTAVNVNDIFTPNPQLANALPEGVTFTSLRQASPDVLDKYYGTVAPLDDPLVALNTLMTQDGAVVHVARNTLLEKPLQLVNIADSPVDSLAFRRVLVVVEEGANAKLVVCDHTGDKCDKKLVNSTVVEIVVEPGGALEIVDMEESSPLTVRHSMAYAVLSLDSRMKLTTSTLQCGITDNSVTVDLLGEHAELELDGMAIGTAKMHISTATAVNHRVPRCKSRQLYKYVLDDDANGSFTGRVLVADGACHTDAHQTNRNILASYGARMHAEPQLEIYNDDVKCSHGATTGQLDANALFYMQQRGIPLHEARTMLMQAFLTDVADSISVESLRARLRHLIDRRFAGDSLCTSCHD